VHENHIEPPVRGWAGYPLGFVAAVAVSIVAVATGGTGHPLWTLTALTGTAAAVATVTTLRAALASGALCWALYAGFVVGRYGVLALTASTTHAAVILAAAVVLAFGIAHAVRVARRSAVTHVVPVPAQRGTSAIPVLRSTGTWRAS
jgi:uncharacterized membrane protein